MTINKTLSIPNQLKRGATRRLSTTTRRRSTGRATATAGRLPIDGIVSWRAAVFAAGGHPASAGAFVRFFTEGAWLDHWLELRRRPLPPADDEADRPAVLAGHERSTPDARGDPDADPAAVQRSLPGRGQRRPSGASSSTTSGNAVHRVAAEGISPEQGVDEAIARIKQILAE